jgi:hypothetical protein
VALRLIFIVGNIEIDNMKTWIIFFSIAVCLIGCVHSKPTTGIRVRSDLKELFEDAVRKTKSIDNSLKSIHILEHTDTHLVVDKINDIDVCSKDVENLVAILQQALEEHPSIDRNIGPHIFAFIDDDGKRKSFDPKQLAASCTACECRGIYVSVRKTGKNCQQPAPPDRR